MRPDLYVGGDYRFFKVFTSGAVISLYLPISILIIGNYFLKLGSDNNVGSARFVIVR